ncbi:crotonase/enoyl-CoA hydratase family protein [Halopseudomonas salegens]|uniref:Enoyl-CoA hydratase n=1 Tax=Halopseudomonas salegens TaxID=1434072 RepID=A0A1H2I0F5_9GAMM|nr:crotonase/enoyl-CoA hydratase family protein [Halopseudomonas salegens]SDU37529.1 enoyl-CoA hydratase [Halopseudomonas salegens]
MSQRLQFNLSDGLAEIVLDDGKVNALSEAMLEELLAAIDEAAAADAALLISGRPGCFSAGYDRKLIAAGGPACDAMRAAGDRLTLALLDYPAPLVIAASGHAMAKAAFMLLLADYRVGTTGDWQVALNEVAIGMTMPQAAMAIARDRVAPQWLSRCALQAQGLTPEQSVQAGFFDELHASEHVLLEARSHVQRLAALPRSAYRETRALLNAPLRAAVMPWLQA